MTLKVNRVSTVIDVRSVGMKKAKTKKTEKGATRVSTVIYVRGTAEKKASGKSAKKTGKKTMTARPRRNRVRDGK